MDKFFLSTVLLLSASLFSALNIQPLPKVMGLPSDSMWIEPSIIPSAGFCIGTLFNITIWFNVTTPTAAWQSCLLYDKTILNATSYGYTGIGKSQWSGSTPSTTWSNWFNHNDTHAYLCVSECLDPPPQAIVGEGTLAWIELMILQMPQEGQSLTTALTVGDRTIQYTSNAWDIYGNSIDLTFRDSILTLGPPTTIIVPDDYATIQSAIDHASQGNTILVRNGTYNERLVLDKSLSLLGENNQSTIIDGGGTGNVITIDAQACHTTIMGFTLRDGENGIVLSSSHNNTILDNIITSNSQYGIQMSYSQDNTLSGNEITENEGGIYIYHPGRNTLTTNLFANNSDFGIYLLASHDNTVTANDVASNGRGICVHAMSPGYSSGNNHFHRNAFVNNTCQFDVEDCPHNIWDQGYPAGGNYWSNYGGKDVFSGPSRNETGSDGLGDSPLLIDADNEDRYPLMGPYGTFTNAGSNVTVFPSDAVGMIFGNVIVEGETTVLEGESGPEPPACFNLGQHYYEIETSAQYSGRITIRIIYDDSSMTQEEEGCLLLVHWNDTAMEWENITTGRDTLHNVVFGEANTLSTFAAVTPYIHDLSATQIKLSRDYVGKNTVLVVDVRISNHGDYSEDFNVIICADTTSIGARLITMGKRTSSTETIACNTLSLVEYQNYSISATIEPVQNETHLDDNYLTNGLAHLVHVGDATGDGLVDISDVARVSAGFGSIRVNDPQDPKYSQYWHPIACVTCPHTPNADITGDSKTDIQDLARTSGNFGWHR